MCRTGHGHSCPRCPASCNTFFIDGDVISNLPTTATSPPSDEENNRHMNQDAYARCHTPGCEEEDNSVGQAIRRYIILTYHVEAICERREKEEEEDDGIDDEWEELFEQLLVVLLLPAIGDSRRRAIFERAASEDDTHHDHPARAGQEDRKGGTVKKNDLLQFSIEVAFGETISTIIVQALYPAPHV